MVEGSRLMHCTGADFADPETPDRAPCDEMPPEGGKCILGRAKRGMAPAAWREENRDIGQRTASRMKNKRTIVFAVTLAAVAAISGTPARAAGKHSTDALRIDAA